MRKTGTALLCALWLLTVTFSAYAQAPNLSLSKAVELAQKTLAASNRVEDEDYYLFSVILTNSSKGQYWYHTYRSIQPSEYNEIFAKVYLNGSVELSGGPFSEG